MFCSQQILTPNHTIRFLGLGMGMPICITSSHWNYTSPKGLMIMKLKHVIIRSVYMVFNMTLQLMSLFPEDYNVKIAVILFYKEVTLGF
jgi:hypothetical protein